MSDGGMTLQALGGVNSPCDWYRVRGQPLTTGGQEHTHTHTYLFYVHTVSALLIVPASLFAHVFCIYLLYFVETCSHFENYFLPQPKKLTFPPLYLLMFFLHLPTVHTFSTYILYILC